MKTESVKVEHGIKFPERPWRPKNPLVNVMMKMKDGDSFTYPLHKRPELAYCARKAGIVIATRMLDDKATVRCWRIKSRRR